MLKIVHIPLDERPCNYNFPKEIFHGEEFEIVRVPFEYMGLKKKPGNIEKIQEFFKKECKDILATCIGSELGEGKKIKIVKRQICILRNLLYSTQFCVIN